MAKQNRTPADIQSDLYSNRIIVVLILCFTLVMSLGRLARALGSVQTSELARLIGYTLVICIPALLFAFGVFYFLKNLKKPETEQRVFSPRFVLVITGILFLIAVFMRLMHDQSRTNQILYALIPILTAVYIIFCTFPKEAFSLSVLTAFNGFCIYLFYKTFDYSYVISGRYFIVAFFALVCITYVLLIFIARKNSGYLSAKHTGLRITSSKFVLWPHIVLPVAIVAVWALPLYFPKMALFYGALGLAGLSIVVGIFYIIMMSINEKK